MVDVAVVGVYGEVICASIIHLPFIRREIGPNSNEQQQHSRGRIWRPTSSKLKSATRGGRRVHVGCVMRATSRLWSDKVRRYKRKMEQGSTGCRKEGRDGPSRQPVHYHDARGEHRTEVVYVDRNRVAIKSYLSYCYLRRNSPQVARNEHARIVRPAAVAERQLGERASSHDDSSNVPPYACLYVHTVEICAHRRAYWQDIF